MTLGALDYAKLTCSMQMSEENREHMFDAAMGFDYQKGVFLCGLERLYNITGDESYYSYIKEWVDNYIDENGELHHAQLDRLDDLKSAVLLFELYEKTGDVRYKKVLDMAMELYENWKTNEHGGFWHMGQYPNQMWLDGLYMACPNLVLYGVKFGEEKYIDMAYHQMKLMWDNMRDERTGLLYHAWDATKKELWADPKTGLSPEFWGRALGWYVVTLFDIASYLPDSYEKKAEFIKNGTELIKAIISYRDEKTKKWFQVVNRGNDPNNWVETSCSCLFTYAICKGINEGYLDESYKKIAEESFEGIVKDIEIADGKIQMDKTCIGTGVKHTYELYLKRPVQMNNLHGMGAFVLMCSEYSRGKVK